MTTLYLSIALFALGAMVGMYLLALVLQNKETPKFVAFVHGVFVVAALILLITYAAEGSVDFSETIVLFVLAAIGGLVLIVRDVRKKPLPKWLALGHGLLAITGFIFLLVNAFGG